MVFPNPFLLLASPPGAASLRAERHRSPRWARRSMGIALMQPLGLRRFSSILVLAGLSVAGTFSTSAQATCPANAPVTCGEDCCPYGDDGRTDVCCANHTCTVDGNCGAPVDAGMCPTHAPISCSFGCCPKGIGDVTNVCCSDGTCTRDGTCGGGATCPSNAPIKCTSGCCPFGANGETNVCCPDGSCTSDGHCAGDGTASQCPSNAPVACPVTCCPYEHDGGVEVCCADNTCTADGQCAGNMTPGTLSDGGVCPQSASISCGDHCCPPGQNGRTDVCCANEGCTTNGVCKAEQPDAAAGDGSTDATAMDAAEDSPSSDAADGGIAAASSGNEDDGGCGCSAPGRGPAGSGALLVGILAAMSLARRRRRI